MQVRIPTSGVGDEFRDSAGRTCNTRPADTYEMFNKQWLIGFTNTTQEGLLLLFLSVSLKVTSHKAL